MKILFIDNFSFNFGVASISSVLKQSGHDVELIYYPFFKLRGINIYRNPGNYFSFEKISNEVIAKKPDIIGFSVFSANYMFYRHAAAAIRSKTEIPILVGGVFPTMSSEFFINNSCCDVVFRGEAELVITELMEKMVTRKYHDMPNIVYRNKEGYPVFNKIDSFVVDLDNLPFYDKNLCPSNPITLNMATSRGCVFSCAYCSSGKYTRITNRQGDGKVRKRSVYRVIEEIKQALSIRPYKSISFWDDFFISSPKWLSDFTVEYCKEINLPYSCVAFPGTVNKNTASLLAQSGCRFVYMGFQTANNEYKKNVLRRNETKEQITKAIGYLRENGVKFGLDLIFNFPGETKKHIEETLDFFVDNRIKWASIYFLNYYPDSYITKYAYENNFITSEQFSKIMKNELIGDQAYGGTIIDKGKVKEQVRYALLFRLISMFPGKWIKWLFKKNIYKLFPVNRYFYYVITLLTVLLKQGFLGILIFIKPYSQFKKSSRM